MRRTLLALYGSVCKAEAELGICGVQENGDGMSRPHFLVQGDQLLSNSWGAVPMETDPEMLPDPAAMVWYLV